MFGNLKTKIEVYLTESYKKGTLKDNLFIFEELILKNKNLSKIFFLYDELSSNKGLNESVANEFINESIVAYENLINKISLHEIKEIKMWVGHVVCENKYKDIDTLFSKNVLTLENKIQSKKIILENLKTEKKEKKEVINVPLKSMVNVANKTIKNYVETLSESEQKELINLLKIPKKSLKENYESIKLQVVQKLDGKKGTSDAETLKTINQVLLKLQKESFTELNFLKLKNLNESL